MTHTQPQRLLLFGLGQKRVGWNSDPNEWYDDYRWCLYIGFILLFYCTMALCCIMAGRCSKGGRNREVHTNEEVQTVDLRKRRVRRRPDSYAYVEEDVIIEEPVVSSCLIMLNFKILN